MSSDNETAWVCIVCGYVHHGATPPESCPICGAPSEDFEASEEPAAASEPKAPRLWRCLICAYVHAGETPPDECPVCGAPASQFEPIDEAGGADSARGAPLRLVVVGGGIAGVSAAQAAREASPNVEITLLSEESNLPYYRLNLSRYLAGEIGEGDLPIHPEGWFDEQRIRLVRGATVARIATDRRVVELDGGQTEPFEKLVLACGAHPFVPPFPGAELPGVTTFRTLADAHLLLEAGKSHAECVCAGGGILGLETAGALARQGAKVTVLEAHDWLLPRQLDRQASEVLQSHVVGLGIEVRLGAKIARIAGDSRVRRVDLEDGQSLQTDNVVIATGIRSNSHLARSAGLLTSRGVIVDAYLTTSHPDIFAGGDVAEHRGVVYGLWGPAQHQGMLAGMNAAGVPSAFRGLPRANTLKVLGLDLFSIGTFTPLDGSYELVRERVDDCDYGFVFHDGRLVGGILLGDTAVASAMTKAIKESLDLSGLLRHRPTAREVAAHLREMS